MMSLVERPAMSLVEWCPEHGRGAQEHDTLRLYIVLLRRYLLRGFHHRCPAAHQVPNVMVGPPDTLP
jgi:hypothetical protein